MPQEVPYEGAEPETIDEILELGERILAKKRSVPGLIDAQNLTSITLYSGELGALFGQARALNRAIDRFTKSGHEKDVGRDEWLELYEYWVLADTICRVSVPITEFFKDNATTELEQANKNLQKIRKDISYIFTEPESRMALRKMVLERSGYGAL